MQIDHTAYLSHHSIITPFRDTAINLLWSVVPVISSISIVSLACRIVIHTRWYNISKGGKKLPRVQARPS